MTDNLLVNNKGRVNGKDYDLRRVNGALIPSETDSSFYVFDSDNSLLYGDLNIFLDSVDVIKVELLRFDLDTKILESVVCLTSENYNKNTVGILFNAVKVYRDLKEGENLLFDGFVLESGLSIPEPPRMYNISIVRGGSFISVDNSPANDVKFNLVSYATGEQYEFIVPISEVMSFEIPEVGSGFSISMCYDGYEDFAGCITTEPYYIRDTYRDELVVVELSCAG